MVPVSQPRSTHARPQISGTRVGRAQTASCECLTARPPGARHTPGQTARRAVLLSSRATPALGAPSGSYVSPFDLSCAGLPAGEPDPGHDRPSSHDVCKDRSHPRCVGHVCGCSRLRSHQQNDHRRCVLTETDIAADGVLADRRKHLRDPLHVHREGHISRVRFVCWRTRTEPAFRHPAGRRTLLRPDPPRLHRETVPGA